MKKKIIWLVVSCLIVVALLLASCGPAVTEEEEAAPPEEEEVITTEEEVAPAEEEAEAVPPPPADTTPPSAITGLIAADAYDGRVNLSWDKSMAEDFDHYDIYVSQAEIVDASGVTPTQQIRNIATNTYQVTGLEDGAKCYFAVTAVDKSGNEDTLLTCVSATPTPMPRGSVDPDISVDVYQSDKAWAGTTLFTDNHNLETPRIIEVNMLGEIIWEYRIPQNLRKYTNPGLDTELLSNNNVLLLLPGYGVHEINRNGDIVWSYLDKKVSHDADRLPNGNTLVVFGNEDEAGDAQVKEINPEGEIVWAWYAKEHFYESPYKDIYDQGWTHTNAATRLPNGNTVISPRNFNFVIEVDPEGSVVKTVGEGELYGPHDPEVLANGNILVASFRPHRAVEIDPGTGRIVWQFATHQQGVSGVRDTDRLPNGNTLLCGTTKIAEVTAKGDIVWQLSLKDVTEDSKGFYKAERIGTQR